MPLLLILIIYDSQQYFASLVRGSVYIQGPSELDMALFGTEEGTLARWFQNHPHPLLDALTGVAYLGFIPAYVLMAAYLHFYLPSRNRGSKYESIYRDVGRVMMHAFLVLTLAGYLTQLIFPVAPPWYVDLYGFEYVVEAPAEAAGAARFDSLVGFPIFESYYAKSTNVFGAMPSLHVGQTFLAFYFAIFAGRLRVLNGLMFVLVFFGAVYLNHHYVIDGLLGIFYALIVGWVFTHVMKPRRSAE